MGTESKNKKPHPSLSSPEILDAQLAVWETARNNYTALSQVEERQLKVNGYTYKVQFNPARIISSAAKVDDNSIRERKCFLCSSNRPSEQKGINFNNHYSILVNPYPIFPYHFTIAEHEHTKQRILLRFSDMIDLADILNDCVIFYNGPECGASAPDHAHFQAGSKGFLPIEKGLQTKEVARYGKAILKVSDDILRTALCIESNDKADAIKLFHLIYSTLETQICNNNEPMMNILVWYENYTWTVCLFLRAKHRPSCYFAEGKENLLISPASVDLGGVFITPLENDFQKITASNIAAILKEICISPADLRKLIQQIRKQL
ncbi:hypothetical protein EZS27_000092 [termite gut metagenome]|uniref:DUF4922 domain-containing protein n=1 Tax=termite gut metagenome TaxID=433724 RepID=A0A5J4T539_9ZZZZ